MRDAPRLREAVRGGVTLAKPRPAEPAPEARPFRIVIEGAIAPDGRVGLGRLEVQHDPAKPVSGLEAEAICRRVMFAPAAAPLQSAMQQEAAGGQAP